MAEGVTPQKNSEYGQELDAADLARARGDVDGALAGYKAALFVVPEDARATRASIYVRIGELKRETGKLREAELNYEKAVRADSTCHVALDRMVEISRENHEVRREIEWRKKRLAAIAERSAQISELVELATVCSEQANDPQAAVEALEAACSLDATEPTLFRSLSAACARVGNWHRVCAVLERSVEIERDPARRRDLCLEAAEVAFERLNDQERGLAILSKSLAEDPTHDEALRRIVAVRTALAEWVGLDALYSQQVERLASIGDGERAHDLWWKIGILRRDRLHDPPRAIEAFEHALELQPSDIDCRAMLADVHLANGDEAAAIAHFEEIVDRAPLRASTYTRLFTLHHRAGRSDRAWLVGSAIVELGTSDLSVQLLVDQHRPANPVRPSRALTDAAWDEHLRVPTADAAISDILLAIGPAAASARLEGLRESRRLPKLDPASRQDESSTVSAVRAMRWAAQVLGVQAPQIHVMDDVPGGMAAVPAAVPTTVLGPDVLRGLNTKELAFVTARHLTYYRPEHYALVFYPTQSDLQVLLLASAKLVLRDLPVPPGLASPVELTRRLLSRAVSKEDRDRLAVAAQRLSSGSGAVDLGSWIRSVEFTAQRAGLFLCGDLSAAMSRLRGETRTIADLSIEDRRADLLSFCTSPQLARVRALVNIDIPDRNDASPPPKSSPSAK